MLRANPPSNIQLLKGFSSRKNSGIVLVDVDSLLAVTDDEFDITISGDEPQRIEALKAKLRAPGVLNTALIDALLTKNIQEIHLFTDKTINNRWLNRKRKLVTCCPSTTYAHILVEILKEKGLTVKEVMTPSDWALHLDRENLINLYTSEVAREYRHKPLPTTTPEREELLKKLSQTNHYGELVKYYYPPEAEQIGQTFREHEKPESLNYNETFTAFFTRVHSAVTGPSVKVKLMEQFKYAHRRQSSANNSIHIIWADDREGSNHLNGKTSSYPHIQITTDDRTRSANDMFVHYLANFDASVRIDSQPDEKESAELQETIDSVHQKLQNITRYYLENSEDRFKQDIFHRFSRILAQTTPTKLQQILEFNTLLNAKNQDITLHRTPSWLRFIYEVVSALTLLPMCYRAIHSHYAYGTWQFWKPASEKALLGVKSNVEKIYETAGIACPAPNAPN